MHSDFSLNNNGVNYELLYDRDPIEYQVTFFFHKKKIVSCFLRGFFFKNYLGWRAKKNLRKNKIKSYGELFPNIGLSCRTE